MAEPETNHDHMRDRAAAALDSVRSQRTEIQRIAGTSAGSTLSAKIAAAASAIAGAESQLMAALSGPPSNLALLDIDAVMRSVSASDPDGLVTEAADHESADTAQAAAVTATSGATRSEVIALSRDMDKLFDPYLKFASAADEEEYRKREADQHRYIEAELAKKTPEGTLNAAGGTIGQMLDANAHGAGDSPEFLPHWNKLVDTTNQQREAMRAAGQSTDEFDHKLRENVRRFLKTKGLSDQEIDARLSANENPLEAVKPYLATDRASIDLEKDLRFPGRQSGGTKTDDLPQVVAAPAKAPAKTEPDFDPVAGLKGAGVIFSQDDQAAGHGLTVQQIAAIKTIRGPG
jgi:hypothetical protein